MGFAWVGLDGQFSFLFGPDANGLNHIRDEHFAVADFACFCGFDDDGNGTFRLGVGQTKFPGGNAQQLSQSLKRLAQLPDNTKVYPGHGLSTTIGDERWLLELN